MPHHIIIAPLVAIYVLLTAMCGIEATALVLGAIGIFAVLAYAFVPPVRARGSTHMPVPATKARRDVSTGA